MASDLRTQSSGDDDDDDGDGGGGGGDDDDAPCSIKPGQPNGQQESIIRDDLLSEPHMWSICVQLSITFFWPVRISGI